MDKTGIKVTKYDGCGKCFLIARRLSRADEDSSNSPEKQWAICCAVAVACGGHIIGVADDWDTSGATDPYLRKELGPWLRNEMGPFDGVIASSVDRLGRDQIAVMTCGYSLFRAGKQIFTGGHDGPWDLNKRSDQTLFSIQALGAEMELWSIQDRINQSKENNRARGVPSSKNSYGYKYTRVDPRKIDKQLIDAAAHEVLLKVAERILRSTEKNKATKYTEAKRLTAEKVLSPSDHRAVMYGREPKGCRWSPNSLGDILCSEATLGYLMNEGRPVLSQRTEKEGYEYAPGLVTKPGEAIRIAPALWSKAFHEKLVKKIRGLAEETAKAKGREPAPKPRAARVVGEANGFAHCGYCDTALSAAKNTDKGRHFLCKARVKGWVTREQCPHAPHIQADELEGLMGAWFLEKYGDLPLLMEVFDPGTDHASRIAELTDAKARLRRDREAGLYDDPSDEAYYHSNVKRISQELAEVRRQPQRAGGHHWVTTGQTPGAAWHGADVDGRRELYAAYGLKAVVFPVRDKEHERVWIHGLDPDAETTARLAKAAAYQQELEEYAEAVRVAAESTDQDWEAEEAAFEAQRQRQYATTPTRVLPIMAEKVLQLTA